MKFNKDNFRYVDHTPKGSNVREIIALGAYLGSTVKGSAKCDPRDNFDANIGETLAALRCNEKIAERRMNNAVSKVEDALVALEKAQAEPLAHRKTRKKQWLWVSAVGNAVVLTIFQKKKICG